MKKEKITISQLEAGALLKFGEFNSIDMSILVEDVNRFADIDSNSENGSFIDEFNQEVDNDILENMQGSIVKEYFDNLEMKEFVLKKIKLLERKYIKEENIFKSFSVPQMKIMNWLVYEGCIIDDYSNGIHNIKLTRRGELYLFLMSNKDEIEEFIKLLKDCGYSDLLFDVYLISQNLQEDSKRILELDRFVQFCSKNNRAFWELTEREYGYKKVRIPVKEKK